MAEGDEVTPGGRTQQMLKRAQRDPRARKTAGTVTMLTFFIVLVVTLGGLIFTGYRTGFMPDPGPYRTGTVTVEPGSCHRQALQLWLVQQCVADVQQWNDDVRPGLTLTDADRVWLISRTPVEGEVTVASLRAWVSKKTAYHASQHVSKEVIMPADQVPIAGWLKIILAIGCFVLAFVATGVAGRIMRPYLLRKYGGPGNGGPGNGGPGNDGPGNTATGRPAGA